MSITVTILKEEKLSKEQTLIKILNHIKMIFLQSQQIRYFLEDKVRKMMKHKISNKCKKVMNHKRITTNTTSSASSEPPETRQTEADFLADYLAMSVNELVVVL